MVVAGALLRRYEQFHTIPPSPALGPFIVHKPDRQVHFIPRVSRMSEDRR